jgi:hypothetical protein
MFNPLLCLPVCPLPLVTAVPHPGTTRLRPRRAHATAPACLHLFLDFLVGCLRPHSRGWPPRHQITALLSLPPSPLVNSAARAPRPNSTPSQLRTTRWCHPDVGHRPSPVIIDGAFAKGADPLSDVLPLPQLTTPCITSEIYRNMWRTLIF